MSLAVNQLIGFGVGSESSAAASVTYLAQSAGDTTGSTSESVTPNLGTARAGDKIVVYVGSANFGGGSGSNSCTIGGNAATNAVQKDGASEQANIWYFDDTSGVIGGATTITVGFALNRTIEMCAVWRLTGVVTGGPTTTSTHDASGTTATLSLNVNSGAVLIGGCIGRRTADDSATWTGVTEDNETTGSGGDYQCSSGSHLCASTEAPRTLTCVWNNSQTRLVGAAAVWNSA